jgi:hypothetical protein
MATVQLSANAQFPDVLSADECSGCREALLLAGIWSSPLTSSADSAWSLEDFFCFVACTAEARARATAVLEDPASSSRPWLDLYPDVVAENARAATRLSKTSSHVGSTDAHDAPTAHAVRAPSFSCDDQGFAAQVVSPLPLRIEHRAGRVVLHYEEHGVEREIRLEGDGEPDRHGPAADISAPLGISNGRFENGAFIVETTGIPAGRLYDWFGGAPHSDKLRAVERYETSDDGAWLDLTLELDDPETLRDPLVVTKRWRRVPGVEILHHGCDVMSAGLEGVFAEYVDPAKLDARRRQSWALQTFEPHGHTTCSVEASMEVGHGQTQAQDQSLETPRPEMVGGRRSGQRRARSRKGRLQVAQPGENRGVAQALRRAEQAPQGHAAAVGDVDAELLHQSRGPAALAGP